MVPEKMNMDQHPDAGKEESSKKIPNGFYLHKKQSFRFGTTERYLIKL